MLAIPAGTRVIRILPPLNLQQAEAAEAVRIIEWRGGTNITMKHLLSLEKLPGEDMEQILAASATMKTQRGRPASLPLAGKIWALLFSKSSTRTRVSFEVGIRELGGRGDVSQRKRRAVGAGRTDQGHGPRAGADDPRRGHPHLRATATSRNSPNTGASRQSTR